VVYNKQEWREILLPTVVQILALTKWTNLYDIYIILINLRYFETGVKGRFWSAKKLTQNVMTELQLVPHSPHLKLP